MFEAVNQLLYKNSTLNSDSISEFNPFITTKTFSFYNKGAYCDYINDTLNIYGNIFETVEDQFLFFDSMIPKLKKRKFEYIKKSKAEPKEEITIPEFLSRREVDLYENLYKYCHE